MLNYTIVYATDLQGGFGKDGGLPNFTKSSLKIFKNITSVNNSYIIMGYNTWKSLPAPLPNRKNIVITSKNDDSILFKAKNLEECYLMLNDGKEKNIFLIGGKKTINAFLNNELFRLISVYHSIHKEMVESDIKINIEWKEHNKKSSTYDTTPEIDTILWK